MEMGEGMKKFCMFWSVLQTGQVGSGSNSCT